MINDDNTFSYLSFEQFQSTFLNIDMITQKLTDIALTLIEVSNQKKRQI